MIQIKWKGISNVHASPNAQMNMYNRRVLLRYRFRLRLWVESWEICETIVFCGLFSWRGSAFEEANPPCGRVKRAVVVVKRWVDVVEEVPD
jgi:hypothetical protein